jgi:hypothetical protein
MVKCWRCAKNNSDGVEHCSVCRAKLAMGAQPWFCRRCFRKCHHDACSQCHGSRAEGEAAAKHAMAASAHAASLKQISRAANSQFGANKWKRMAVRATSIKLREISLSDDDDDSQAPGPGSSSAAAVAALPSGSSAGFLRPLGFALTGDVGAAVTPARPRSKEQPQRKPPSKAALEAVGPMVKLSEGQRFTALERLVGIKLPQIVGDTATPRQGLGGTAAADATCAAAEAAAGRAAEDAQAAEANAAEADTAAAAQATQEARSLRESVGEERRRDPHDGTVATQEEFEAYYGGVDEWQAAWPAATDGGDGDGGGGGYGDDGGFGDGGYAAGEDYGGGNGAGDLGPYGRPSEYRRSSSLRCRLNPYGAAEAEEVAVFKAIGGPSWELRLVDDGSNVVGQRVQRTRAENAHCLAEIR